MKPLTHNLLLIVLTSLLVGCSFSQREVVGQPVAPAGIKCQVFYRPSSSANVNESTLTLSANGDHQSIDFDALMFDAQYQDDPFEGRTFLISITDPKTGSEIARYLYQIDQQKGLINQFAGGHGFTGLTYVYYPGPMTDLQFFCEVE